ncbi:hypothetical protein VTJ49DRAFT_910 [Mycothermus thermophilus]|uniref:SET domain-containing protein n=1 Tax=Humicola insolens TaxID=85995 RepID=A0ABR3VDU9_HUMIN
MHRPTLPIESLPFWARLNDVSFRHVKVSKIDGRGYGVVCEDDVETAEENETGQSTLVTVPHDLVLNAAAVDEYAKEDKNFRQLLDAMIGHRSTRTDILLFLLVQTALASRSGHGSVGVSNPWTEYLQFLPETVPVPTLWTEDERLLLRGTSLEAAVNAKLSALDAEFGLIQQKSSDIPAWNELLWEGTSAVSFPDWIRLDALYRSRSLELPRSGEALVPCLDMANHSASPTAYYDENLKDEVVLVPRPGVRLSKGDEVTISYGETKSAAEMLFSYGFVDPEATTGESLVLPLNPFPDDPLAKAKLVAFGQPPRIHVARDGDVNAGGGPVRWASAFAYFMCVNEEDGLEFRVLQERDGGRQLRVFWQGADVTDRTSDFEALTGEHSLAAIFRLRVVVTVQETLRAQLERLEATAPQDPTTPSAAQREECFRSAMALRSIDTKLLEHAVEALEDERLTLLADKNVVAYLGLTEATESDLAVDEAANETDDFS